MHFEWLEHPAAAGRVCPVCGSAGTTRERLTVDSSFRGRPRLLLLGCEACGTAFYDDPSPPAYEGGEFGAGYLKYYVELGAGLDAMLAPLFRIDPARVRSLLEIGCGYGFSLDFARQAFGWTVRGLDPSPLAAAGRADLGLDIRSAYLAEDTDLGAAFDLALCAEVVEHLAAPAELLGLVARSLAEGGALLVTTPNALTLRRDAPAADVLSILAPGFHLVLYSPQSLEMLLRKAGFPHVQVWEHANSLHAVASRQPYPASRPAAVDRRLLQGYLRARIGGLPPDSPAACGLTYRLFKEVVSAGGFREADRLFAALGASWRRRYAIDLESPAALARDATADLDFEEFSRRYPFNLGCTLFYKGLCELQDRRDQRRAAEYFRAAWRAGVATATQLSSPLSITDIELEHLTWQARLHALYALAAADPAGAAAEFRLITGPSPAPGADSRFTGLPDALVGPARRELLVSLARGGGFAEARSLIPDLAAAHPAAAAAFRDLDGALAGADRARGARGRGALRALLAAPAMLRLNAALLSFIHGGTGEVSSRRRWLGRARLVLTAFARRIPGRAGRG